MTGLPDHNFPEFNRLEDFWADMGWNVLNPARNFDGETGRPRKEYMRADYKAVLKADAIALLPGWQGSEGSMAELSVAQELELEIYDAVTGYEIVAGVRLTGYIQAVVTHPDLGRNSARDRVQ